MCKARKIFKTSKTCIMIKTWVRTCKIMKTIQKSQTSQTSQTRKTSQASLRHFRPERF
jgi:hypothetical protein